MKISALKTALVLSIGAAILLPISANAAITGKIDVKLKVDAGCEVVGSTVAGNLNDFGTLDFGQTGPKWSNVLTGQVASSAGGQALQVKCDPSISSINVAVNGGNANDGKRNLVFGTNKVPYSVFQDAARTQEFVTDTPVTLALVNNTVSVPVFGSIPVNAVDAVKGEYKDTLLVNISF